MPVGPIGLEERTKVELVDHVRDEPGHMIGRQPVTHIGWEQERWSRSQARKLSAMADPMPPACSASPLPAFSAAVPQQPGTRQLVWG